MDWTLLRRVFGLLVFAFSIAALVWGYWPLPVQARSLEISPAEMLPAELPAGQDPDRLVAIAEPRTLSLEWPSQVRAGDSAAIRMIYALVAPQVPKVRVFTIPADAYSILLVSRLELPRIPHTPLGEVSQALLPGRPLTFMWDLRPITAGEANGTVWLHLRLIPPAGDPELRKFLSDQRIQVQVIDFFGLTGPWARALGSAGMVVGAAFGLDGIARWLWQRWATKPGV